MSDLLIDFSKFNQNSDKNLIKPTHKKKKSIKNISIARNKETENLTSKDIQHSLALRFIGHNYVIYNAFIFEWESDFFSVSESDYLYEIEIKITRADYKDDFNKSEKHLLLENFQKEPKKKPNKFFYAVPKGLLSTFEVPEYAGLIEVTSRNSMATIVKDAPFLHKEKILNDYKDVLLNKFYRRYRDIILENNFGG
jgi:hypothetical protein